MIEGHLDACVGPHQPGIPTETTAPAAVAAAGPV